MLPTDPAAPPDDWPRTLPVAGGTLALAPRPGGASGAGDAYLADLARIVGWRPRLVLSLVEAAELTGAAAALPADLAAAGIAWRSFPVPDYGVPGPDAAAAWPAESIALRAALAGHGRALVHCAGGRGRSGMIALRLMVEAGEAPAVALARLRHARPGAVETEAQRLWAAGT
ncbi:protein-tyrosine phosphatase family protein [Wenxinia marina]|uniref:Tyrosine specific protein phosphatases domain-containing protein n=1 Tax=Wenxinia marina DSM 24838 TaxID=1123501 RepID=A0A0D0NGG3_9RHOB|nr:hypothetical protein [Wenxinia marina]KIQ67420.1 hypothetical protein Wenmar_03842 [Wenxinia marina DSM 24838]GGL69627.1 hypothetical protein GCM10011392_25160 [Wenxinia marina]